MRRKIVLALAVIALTSGCVGQGEPGISSQARTTCVEECEAWLNEGKDLSDGPCLSDKIVQDWVCDVAHSPRKDVDNKPENQCDAYKRGEAHHFVEVDPNCDFIRAI